LSKQKITGSMLHFSQQKQHHNWVLKIVTIILLFAFLGWTVWWYFNYKIETVKLPQNKSNTLIIQPLLKANAKNS
jgi:hypothetical protein